MTSSFNLSRRPKQTHTDWEAFARFGGLCPVGWDTTLVGNHDYKVCKLRKERGTPADMCNEQNLPDEKDVSYINGSANTYANNLHNKVGLTAFSPVLYDPNASPEWMYNQIPYNLRGQLHEPRAYFDRYDYYRLPTKYDGTGYDPVRWPPYRGGIFPQYAYDNVDLPPVWDPNQFRQPYPIQLSSEAGLEDNSTTLTTRYNTNKRGCFYGECASYDQFNRDCFL